MLGSCEGIELMWVELSMRALGSTYIFDRMVALLSPPCAWKDVLQLSNTPPSPLYDATNHWIREEEVGNPIGSIEIFKSQPCWAFGLHKGRARITSVIHVLCVMTRASRPWSLDFKFISITRQYSMKEATLFIFRWQIKKRRKIDRRKSVWRGDDGWSCPEGGLSTSCVWYRLWPAFPFWVGRIFWSPGPNVTVTLGQSAHPTIQQPLYRKAVFMRTKFGSSRLLPSE